MKLTKTIIVALLMVFAYNASAQKVKMKKGFVYVDKVKFLKVEKVNGSKYFFSTLDDVEFLSVSLEKFGTGKHMAVRNPVPGQDTEIYHYYSVFKFLDIEDLDEAFEVDEGSIKELIRMMHKSKIVVDGELSTKNIKRLKEKYSDNVSERRFLTKN
ncbi:hypothetical protein [Winogradskyella tangerina]|uniref:hypothetical protein n=1 Tax=Winogradskyella tangerina TaxID=2023240 RepID=UPI000DBE25E4|nr:hypothetical protein [Winogradskyella tangerina]